jgi:cytochrome b561
MTAMYKAFDDEAGARVSHATRSSRGRFDAATIFLHWLTVFLFLPLIASALLLSYGDGIDRRALLDIHRGAGAMLWCAMFGRLLWRSSFAHLPPFPPAMTTVHRWLVKASEYALYALMLMQPITGLLMTLLQGKPFTLVVWQVPALLPRNFDLAQLFHQIHEPVGYALFCLIGLHGTAALFHHYVLRDDILEAMLPTAKRARR